MKVIKAIIIDDESRARRVLKNLLSLQYCQNVEIIGESPGVVEGVELIKNLKPDVVFLDVQMPKYAGYEIVDFFDDINFEIVFVTAFDKYAIKAFELCAIDYLVKPIKRKRLFDAVQRLLIKLEKENKINQYETLLKSIKEKRFNKLIIPELNNRRVVEISDIIAIEADGSYTTLLFKDKSKITTSKNLKYYESVLPRDSHFFRSHRSWIINIESIKTFNRTDSLIVLENNIIAKISRNNYEAFEALFKMS